MKKVVSLIILTLLFSGCVEAPPNPYQKEFGGITLNFRADLNEAGNVPVYPNEMDLRNAILNFDVEEIGIAYISNDAENAFYLADSYELAYKLTIINKYYFNETKPINSIPVSSISEANSMALNRTPVIMLLGPSKTNLTQVNVSGYFITVEGKSLEEINRTYTELDLATDKLLLVLME